MLLTCKYVKDWIWRAYWRATQYSLVATSDLKLILSETFAVCTTADDRSTGSAITPFCKKKKSCTNVTIQSFWNTDQTLVSKSSAEYFNFKCPWRQSHQGLLSQSPYYQLSGEIIYRQEQLNPLSNYSILRHRHQMHWLLSAVCRHFTLHSSCGCHSALP